VIVSVRVTYAEAALGAKEELQKVECGNPRERLFQ
jgi:hypothetical protein